jgi:hypothetical protein
MSPIHTAKESLVIDLDQQVDGAQPAQLKRMEWLTHLLKNELTFGAE